MLKLRLQGTKREITWFCKLMKKCKSVPLLQHSKMFSNKGTDKYYRMYADIQEKEIKEDNKNE